MTGHFPWKGRPRLFNYAAVDQKTSRVSFKLRESPETSEHFAAGIKAEVIGRTEIRHDNLLSTLNALFMKRNISVVHLDIKAVEGIVQQVHTVPRAGWKCTSTRLRYLSD